MHAIVLAGGFGKRLNGVVPNLPKPMAPIHDQPFLAYLLNYLQQQGIRKITFSVHYLHEFIQNFFKTKFNQLDIHYAIEEQPLGTGGAILHALRFVDKAQPVFVINGDTFVKLNYQAMYRQHIAEQALLSLSLREVADCSRYGKVIMEEQVAISFKEKGELGAGLINAGVYLLNPDLFTPFNLPQQFSFETDFLFPQMSKLKPQVYITEDYFIDIGIPEDYARAQQELG